MEQYIFFFLALSAAAAVGHLFLKLRTIQRMRRNLSRQLFSRFSVDETATVQNEERESRSGVTGEILVSDLINDHRLDELKRM